MKVPMQAVKCYQRYFWVLLVIGCLAPLAAYAADWPQFLGLGRDGISRETGLLAHRPADGPPRVWQRAVGAGFSGPVVAAGRLVLFHRLGDKEVAVCLDAATGEEKWQFAYPTGYRDDFGMDEGPRSTPLIAGSRVYTLAQRGKCIAWTWKAGKKSGHAP